MYPICVPDFQFIPLIKTPDAGVDAHAIDANGGFRTEQDGVVGHGGLLSAWPKPPRPRQQPARMARLHHRSTAGFGIPASQKLRKNGLTRSMTHSCPRSDGDGAPRGVEGVFSAAGYFLRLRRAKAGKPSTEVSGDGHAQQARDEIAMTKTEMLRGHTRLPSGC